MKFARFLLQHSRKLIVVSLLAGAISGACNAALLGAVNAALKQNAAPTLIWSFAGLCFMLALTRFTSEAVLTKLGHEAMFKLRMQLCRQIAAAPLRRLEQLGSARLLATLNDDIPSITNILIFIPSFAVNLALVAGCLVYMASLSWLLLVIVLGFILLGFVTYQLPIMRAHKLFALARNTFDSLQEHFRALTQGAKELKIHDRRRQAFMTEDLETSVRQLQKQNTNALILCSAAGSWGQILVFVVMGLALFALAPAAHLSKVALSAYAITLLYLVTPLQAIMNILPQTARANVALNKVEEIGFSLSRPGVEELNDAGTPLREWRTLELAGITHRYWREGESESFVFGPINLRFVPGEMVFITGGNGSGKTTLIKLLTGLYLPESGQILLNGEPIADHNRTLYRQLFSVVFSDFYLFGRLLGLDGPDADAHARQYLDELKLAHKVQIKDGKLSTTELSQGQQKRLALLTAYMEDRPIYIFDEWAADQDSYFKNVFYTEMLPELKARQKTVFAISHDDRYYGVADRIIKLDEGQVSSDLSAASEKATLSAAHDKLGHL